MNQKIRRKDLNIEEAADIELNARKTYHTYSYKIAYPKEYIRICKHYGKTPIIELKWGFTKELVDEVMKLLIQEDMYDKSIIICFTYELVLYIKERYPDYQKVCTDYAGCCGTYPAFYALACP